MLGNSPYSYPGQVFLKWDAARTVERKYVQVILRSEVSEVGNRVMEKKENGSLPWRVVLLIFAWLGSSSATLSPTGINYEGQFLFGISSFPFLFHLSRHLDSFAL